MADDEVINPLGLPTTNYGWIKPTVGGDNDAWGGLLNTDLDNIDTTVKSVSTVANAAQTSTQVAAAIAAAAYVLPTASTTVLGGVKVDGTTVSIASGVISAAGAVAVSATAPSSPVAGSLWFDTNGGQMYVWYNDGTSSQWVPVVNQGSAPTAPLIVTPPVAASWTQRNFGGSTTLTNVSNGVKLFDSSVAAIGNTMRGATIASPATPYTIDATFSILSLVLGTSGNCQIGVGWTDGTKIQYLNNETVGSTTTPAVPLFNVLNMTNFTTFGSGSGLSGNCLFNPGSMYVRLADDGTNVTFALSTDGVNFVTAYSAAKSGAFLGASGYTNVGFFIMAGQLGNGGQATMTLKSWWVH